MEKPTRSTEISPSDLFMDTDNDDSLSETEEGMLQNTPKDELEFKKTEIEKSLENMSAASKIESMENNVGAYSVQPEGSNKDAAQTDHARWKKVRRMLIETFLNSNRAILSDENIQIHKQGSDIPDP